MALYMVSYDIPEESLSYAKVVDYLESIEAKRVLESQWLVAHEGNSEKILNKLRRIADKGDRLLVQRVDAHDSDWENLLIEKADLIALHFEEETD